MMDPTLEPFAKLFVSSFSRAVRSHLPHRPLSAPCLSEREKSGEKKANLFSCHQQSCSLPHLLLLILETCNSQQPSPLNKETEAQEGDS